MLGDVIDTAVRAAVREALAIERPAIVAAVRAELAAEALEPKWWTPSQVRSHARCSSAAVFDALKNGELIGTSTNDPNRARGRIPGTRWRIRPADARAWAESRRTS